MPRGYRRCPAIPATQFHPSRADDNELLVNFVDNETFWTVPLVSIGAEYYPFQVFGIRGSVRGSVLMSRVNTDRQDYSGDPADLGDARRSRAARTQLGDF